jgi:hypothetical protein
VSIYGIIDPAAGKVVYVGHSRDVDVRMRMHREHRRSPARARTNPGLYGWLASLLTCPGYKILAVAPYERRYQVERQVTLRLRKTCALVNICDGAAVSGPMPLERREAIRLGKLGKRRGSAESPSAAAA